MKTLPIDIHTHYSPTRLDGQAVVSLSVGDTCLTPEELVGQHPEALFSVGLHPWHVNPQWQSLIDSKLIPLLDNRQVVAIGEAGLDRLRGAEWPLQIAAFTHQAHLAAEAGKPLVIHCVKAFDELARIHKASFAKKAWIIHGFRGKAEQAAQLTRQGCCLSFGQHCNEEAVRQCPAECLFIETDESPVAIQALYERVAMLRQTDAESLQMQVKANMRRLLAGGNGDAL